MTRLAGQTELLIVPCSLADANRYVRLYHRHHEPVITHKYSMVVCELGGTVHGVAIVGRPVARMLDDGLTLEVNRLCTDGWPNACSALYSAAWRAGRALGYVRMVTYILESESGVSLKAAGWRLWGTSPGGSWSNPGRRTIDRHPLGPKARWQVESGHPAPALVWPEEMVPGVQLGLGFDEETAPGSPG